MLEKFLLDFGYNDTNIIMIKYDKKLSGYSETELCVRIKEMCYYLLILGYSHEDVLKMTLMCPEIFVLSKMDIDNRMKLLLNIGYREEEVSKMIKNNPRMLVLSDDQINYVIDILGKFGNNSDDIKNMTVVYTGIFNNGDTLETKFNGLIDLGLDYEAVNSITKKMPTIYGLGYDEYVNKIKYLKEIGFSSKSILKLVKESDYFNLISLDDVKRKIKEFDILGFSVLDIDKMILVYPNMFMLNLSDIIEKIQCFGSFGFYYSNSSKMIKDNANLLRYSNEMIKERIEVFYLYGYSGEEINELLLKYPVIFDMDFLNLVRKLEFLQSVKLSKKLIQRPKILFYNIEDMYSRYVYLTSNGVKVNSKNSNILFINSDDFSRKYDVKYEDVIANYKNNRLLSGYSLRRTKKK